MAEKKRRAKAPVAPEQDCLPDREERAQRLRAIKERIRSGEYAPDVKDVAYLLATMMTPQ